MTQPTPTKLWHQAFVVLMTGTVYWGLAAMVFDVKEPWDALLYGSVLYPVSLGLSAAFGARSNWRPWVIGMGLMFPQILIMAVADPITPMLMFGIGIAAALSLPAILVAWLAARILGARRR